MRREDTSLGKRARRRPLSAAGTAHYPAVARPGSWLSPSSACSTHCNSFTRVRADSQAIQFIDVTETAGIDFRHCNGASGQKYLAEITGSGCGFVDYDGDGYLDIFLVNGGRTPGFKGTESIDHALYRNNRDGTFINVTQQAGDSAQSRLRDGLAAGDYNNDGYVGPVCHSFRRTEPALPKQPKRNVRRSFSQGRRRRKGGMELEQPLFWTMTATAIWIFLCATTPIIAFVVTISVPSDTLPRNRTAHPKCTVACRIHCTATTGTEPLPT